MTEEPFQAPEEQLRACADPSEAGDPLKAH